MPYGTYTLPNTANMNASANGLEAVFVYIGNQVPMFFPMMLGAFFMIIFFSGLILGKRQEGRESISLWFFLAGFATTVVATLLYLLPGVINTTTYGICIGIMALGALWFFNTRG